MNKLRVFTAFSGYDSQCLALNRLKESNPDFDYELVGWSEIDKYAVQAHNALFPRWSDRNLGDISKIDWTNVPDFDLFTYSSPCQDFSNAGLQKGGEKGSGTRSSLLWECEKAIITKRPKYCILENVKALVSKKFIDLFMEWCEVLGSYGYTNYWQVLNAKDYGVPQNRERVFLVSVLDGRKFKFPKPIALSKRLKDILEEKVEDRYYLSTERVESLFKKNEENKEKGIGFKFAPVDAEDIAKTITSRPGDREYGNFIKQSPVICRQVGRNPDNPTRRLSGLPTEQMIEIGGGVSNCLSTVQKDNMVVMPDFRIRKLTSTECFRLMGVSDKDIQAIQKSGISNTQQYKMAGNSIVVDVLYHIFNNLIFTPSENIADAQNEEARIVKVGNYHKSNYNASVIVDPQGISPTVMENHGTVTAILEAGRIDTRYKSDGRIIDTKGVSPIIRSEMHGHSPLIFEEMPQASKDKTSRPFRLHFSINITI